MADEENMETGTHEDEADEENVEIKNQISDNDDDSDSSDEDEIEEEAKNEEMEKKISTFAKEISQNPYMYDNHTQRIQLLRSIGDLHRLREARESMSSFFPLTEELWLDWLRDEIKLVSDDNDKKKLDELFERAFGDYQSIPVWLEYVQYTIGRMDEEGGVQKVRDGFERAITAVGLHVSQGANIWEAYREFETALTAGLMPQPGVSVTKEQEECFQAQNQRVVSLFKRQLALPLLHMQATVEEYKEWLGETDIDPETQTAIDKAQTVLDSVQSIEDRLLTKEGNQLEAYQEYIKIEMKSSDPARIQCIYERALKENCLVADLWLQYTKYLDNLGVKQLILLAYDRALRNCPWSSHLWTNYLLALERQNTEFMKMKETANKALSVGFSEASDYLMIWSGYCDYLKRRIDWSSDHEEQLETFRLTVEKAVDFMFENYGKEGDPEGRLRQFWAYIESKYCKNQERSREIWTQLMQEGHGAEAGMWLQYYQLERMFGDNKHCRKILQKALNSVTDWPESITQAYINFEREEGSLEQFDTAMTRCEAQLQRINERRTKIQEREAAMESGKKKDKWDRKAHAKKQQGFNQSASSDTTARKSATLHPKDTSGTKRKFNEREDGFIREVPVTQSEPERKKLKEDTSQEDQRVAVKHDSAKDNITVFVSNIDFSIEEDRLKQVFSKCGELSQIRLVRNYKGKSKGFGYVEFTDSNAVIQALRLDREFLDGRPMFVSRCEDRSNVKSAPQFKYSTVLEKNKLFIKGLPFTTTKDALETIFKEYGKVKDVRMVTYRNGRPKGLAFIEFDTAASAAQAVMKADGLQIGEHVISVAISNPPERKAPLSSRIVAPEARHVSLGGGKKETEFRGKARTQVSLVPRAIRQQQQSQQAASKPTSTPTEGKGTSKADSRNSSAMSNDDFRKMLLK